jgi:hypothetical protein
VATVPELTVLVPLGGRDVEMRKPTDGSLVVLARTFRGLPKIENVAELTDEHRERLIRNLGILGKIVEGMIVKDDDKNWLDDAMIDGDVKAEDVFDMIRAAGEKFNGGVVAAKKAAPPVRRRAR